MDCDAACRDERNETRIVERARVVILVEVGEVNHKEGNNWVVILVVEMTEMKQTE